MRAAGSWARVTFASRVRVTVSWRRGRDSLDRSPAGGSRAPRAGGGTQRCSCPAAAMMCAMCVRIARSRADRARQRGKSDMLDSERIPRETLAHSLLPKAFKRAGADSGPDEHRQLLALWNNQRRSILTGRQHLVGEAEYLLCELPLELREELPATKAIRPRLAALAPRNSPRRYDAPTRLRLQLLDSYRTQIRTLDREERQVVAQLEALVDQSGSTLGELCGLSTRSVAELLVEVGHPRG